MWGCITAHGVGKLIRIKENITSERYTKILEDGLFGSIDMHKLNLRNITFMHDNATVHSSKFTNKWLNINKVNTIEWPSCSPDLNPIENLWEILHQKVRKANIKPRNKDGLWNILEREWYSINSDIVRKLYLSMTKRINNLYENNGGYTKY